MQTNVNSKNTLQSATVRINEAYGVKLFKVPEKSSNFCKQLTLQINRIGIQIHDSDTSWWEGSVNLGNAPFHPTYNYGWGSYNIGSHKVSGDSVFGIQLQNGTFKKFAILK